MHKLLVPPLFNLTVVRVATASEATAELIAACNAHDPQTARSRHPPLQVPRRLLFYINAQHVGCTPLIAAVSNRLVDVVREISSSGRETVLT